MIKRLFLYLLAFYYLTPLALTDDQTRIEVQSEFMGEARPLFIRLPAGYSDNPARTYPTLFVLNEEDNFN